MDYGIRIDIDSKSAVNGLANLKKALSECETKTKTLQKAMSSVNGSGLNTVAKNVDRLSRSTEGATKSINGLASAGKVAGAVLATVFSAEVARRIVKYSDAYTEMQNKIRALGGETVDYVSVQNELFEVSNRARTDVTAMTQLYSRLMLAQKNLGASSQDLMRFTEGIGKAMQISGASAFTQRGVLLQLSQAMGTDIVRAEEFNSILEGGIRIAQAAADGIAEAGGSVATLRKLVIEGKISSEEFFNAIMSQLPKMEAEFAKTTPTIQQAFVVLNNNITRYVGEANKATGASRALGAIIFDLSQNIDALVKAFGFLIGSSVVVKIYQMVTAFKAAATAGKGLSAVMTVISKHPIGAALAALGTAYLLLRDSSDSATKQIKIQNEALKSNIEWAEKGYIVSKKLAEEKLKEARATLKSAQANLEAAKAELERIRAAEANSGILDMFWQSLTASPKDVRNRVDAAEKITEYRKQVELAAQAVAAMKQVLNQSVADKQKRAVEEASKEEQKRQERIKKTIADLQFEEQQLKRTSLQQEIYNNLKKVGLENATVSETGVVSGLSGTDLQSAQAIADSTVKIINLQKAIENAKKSTKSAQEYLKEWGESMLDWGQNVSNGFISAFGQAEDAIIDFAKTGKFSFSDFAESVVEDISRIIIRAMIAKTVMAAIGFADSGSTSSGLEGFDYQGYDSAFASGMADAGLAHGGLIRGAGTGTSDSIPARLSNGEFVVNAKSTARYRPMLEAMNANRFAGGGIAGGDSGGFGSNVNIQVIDQRGANSAPVETQESTGPNGDKIIKMIIRDTVKQGFANGEYDSSMRSIYGIRRAGIKR